MKLTILWTNFSVIERNFNSHSFIIYFNQELNSKAFSLYQNIDILHPYPNKIRNNLIKNSKDLLK
jgi:hypothetical protein